MTDDQAPTFAGPTAYAEALDYPPTGAWPLSPPPVPPSSPRLKWIVVGLAVGLALLILLVVALIGAHRLLGEPAHPAAPPRLTPITVTVTPSSNRAPVPAADQAFFDDLTREGVPVGSPAIALHNAQVVCQADGRGETAESIATALAKADTTLSGPQAHIFVAVAMNHYCPAYGGGR